MGVSIEVSKPPTVLSISSSRRIDHSAPAGSFCLIIIAVVLPSSMPAQNLAFIKHVRNKFTRKAFARIDILGTILLLAFSVLLVFALEEAGSRYPWSSPIIIATMVLGGVSGIAFLIWEWFLEKSPSAQEPTFPLSLLKNQVLAGMMASAFFIGFPFVAIVVNIPQRAQAVYGFSPLRAGLALLPLLLTSPLATALSGYLTSNLKIPPLYLILIGAVLQVVGVGLTCSLPTNTFSIPPQQYGLEVLMGLGFGLGLSTLLTLARLVVDEANLAVTMAALTQVRVLGGTISLAIWCGPHFLQRPSFLVPPISIPPLTTSSSTILNNHLRPRLALTITPSQSQAISDSLSAIHTLDPDKQDAIRRAFAEGYNQQNIFLTAMTGVGLIASLFIWERRPRRVE
jgi:hypothetical protein